MSLLDNNLSLGLYQHCRGYCQLKPLASTGGMSDELLRYSRYRFPREIISHPCGSTPGSTSVSARSRAYRHNAASSYRTKRSVTDVRCSAPRTPADCEDAKVPSVTSGIPMNSSSRFVADDQHLRRAVEQDADVIDILVQPRRDHQAATVLSNTTPPGWPRAASARHRSPGQLSGRASRRDALRRVRYRALRQQLRRSLAPTDDIRLICAIQ
jgi:hypothetical protein